MSLDHHATDARALHAGRRHRIGEDDPSVSPDPIDVQIGTNLRVARKFRSLSQDTLAASLGVSFQQLQKYERGTNRISGSMIARACAALDIPPNALFDGVAGLGQGEIEGQAALRLAALTSGGLEVLQGYAAMRPDQRGAVLATVRAIAGRASGEG